MEGEEQISEDGEIVKSPTKHSPIQLSKDPSSFHVSEDEYAEDTADSLDIKPPQAAVAHHHKSGSRSGASKRERDKHHKDPLREHGHVSIKSEAISVSHRKNHRRVHREHRDERFRDKRHHRQRHEGMRDDKHEHDFSRGKVKEKSGGERMLEDLRERLLDKRRAGGKHERRERERERERREEEEAAMAAAAAAAAAVRETPREKAERVEREMRRERLLEAGQTDRERVRQKEVYRRELEARRERHYLEKEKERTLREIVKRRERSRSQERKKRRLEEGEEDDEDMEAKEKDDVHDVEGKKESGEDEGIASQLVVVSSGSEPDDPEPGAEGKEHSDGEQDVAQDNSSAGEEEDEEEAEEEEDDDDDDDDSSTSSETDDDDRDTDASEGGHSDEENFHSHVRSPSRSVSREHSGEETPLASAKKDRRVQEDDEMLKKQGPPSPLRAPDALLTEKQAMLPPYLPAIQGCRSVDEFQCLNRIEEGTYGVVYRAKDLRTQEVVALKRLKMEKEKEGFPITSLREINTLLKAQHANIVTVREIVVGSNMDKIYIVMDYVEHDLKSLMETMKSKKQVFIPGEVKCLMQQLLRAVAHLHDNWILHRDLKTSNLLLSHKGILKVGDFGLAREYGSPLKHYTPIVVTLWYRAPELLLCSKEYSTPIDMWSVGCIFGEFLTMEALFPGKSEVDQLNRIFKDLGTPNEKVWPGYNKLPGVQKMTFTEYPVNQLRQRFGSTMITDTGMELMNRFLTYDPSQRVTAEEALKHEYFREAPLPIDPAMFPTWPAKSELGHRKAAAASPKPPPGGAEYKQLGDTDEDMGSMGFHMGIVEKGRAALGPGFSLKF